LSREKSKIKIKIIFPKTLDFWLLLCYNYITKEREVKQMGIFNKISDWLGFAKKVTYTLDDKQYNCYVGQGCFSGSVEVLVYEYRPNKKIHKEKSLDSKWFWLDDYDTIEEGVKTVLAQIVAEQNHDLEMQRKWEEFEKNY
jgi:uncharacterized protein YydD (DUF2326 family)